MSYWAHFICLWPRRWEMASWWWMIQTHQCQYDQSLLKLCKDTERKKQLQKSLSGVYTESLQDSHVHVLCTSISIDSEWGWHLNCGSCRTAASVKSWEIVNFGHNTTSASHVAARQQVGASETVRGGGGSVAAHVGRWSNLALQEYGRKINKCSIVLFFYDQSLGPHRDRSLVEDESGMTVVEDSSSFSSLATFQKNTVVSS